MAIQLIPNQRFIFDQRDFYCSDDKYCQLIANGDEVKIQFKQTPCGGNVLCNPEFTWTLGSELTDNGTFSGTSSPWTLFGGWTWGGDKITTGAGSCSPCDFEQDIGGTLTAGKYYKITIEITDNAGDKSGTLKARLGGTYSGEINGDGTHTLYVRAGVADTLLHFDNISTAGNGFSIDSISLKEMVFENCWQFSDNQFLFNDNPPAGFCHVPAVIGDAVDQAGTLTNGVLYKIVLAFNNRTQGSVDVSIGSNGSGSITANGEQVVYILADGTDITLGFTNDFDGCMQYVYAYPLINNYIFDLYDLDGNLIANLDSQGSVSYVDEYVTFDIFFKQGVLLANGDDEVPLPYGCYLITITDPCSADLLCNGEFDSEDCWDLSDGDTIADGTLTMMGDIRDGGVSQPVITLANTCYKLCYDIEALDGGPLRIDIGDFSLILPNGFKGPGCIEFFQGIAGEDILITFASASPTVAIVNYLSLKACVNYTSNCLTWKEDFAGSSLVTGDCDEEVSLGFRFDLGNHNVPFTLSNRLFLSINNPTYPQDEEDYLFSTGARILQYAQSEKYYNISFFAVDEATHDNIRAMTMTDHFVIDSIEYFVKKGEYKPLWDRKGERNTSESQIDAKKKTLTLFNRNI